MKTPPLTSALDRSLRVLHLEDCDKDRILIQESLRQQNLLIEFTDVSDRANFVKALDEKPFDLILSDKSLPGFDGLAALHIAKGKLPHIPFVFVSGSMGEEAAINTIKDGATDYVLKDRLGRLVPAVERAIRDYEKAQKAREAEDKIREQAALLDHAQEAIIVTDMAECVLYWNKSAERIYGWPAGEAIGRKAAELAAKDPTRYEAARECLLKKGSWTGEFVTANRAGNAMTVESRWTLVRDTAGSPKSILIIDSDITEKKQIEIQFLRSQRMDSIGALAAGIAHDLNNALAPVVMAADVLRLCDDQATRERFMDIVTSSAQRATSLVKQILAFARGSGGQIGPIKLRPIIRDTANMVKDTFPKSIKLSVNIPEKGMWMVQGDVTEIHQVLLNLCVNARDAMPQGGQLTLSAQNMTLGSETTAAHDAPPGGYVMVSLRDTGSGIPPEVLPRIFDPFFTTKIGDKGTGLGLSTVAGIVKHQRGFIEVKTELGKGTEFKIYFPAIFATETTDGEAQKGPLPTGRGELILVVDDEEAVRELIKTTLETYGYRVLTAQNGVQGINLFKEHQEEIRLLVTDTDMPHMDGMATIEATKALKPDIPVIIASGSKRDTEQIRKETKYLTNLGKPFSVEQLLIAVGIAMHQ
jgi:two-component system, cell cycle sensor histidine kinase and response regulator CckA